MSQEIGYNLKKPCKDCPFRRDVPIHHGVAKELITMHGSIEMGTFGHSCHKTDNRSDGFQGTYSGQVEHCAGALIMLKNMGPEAIQNHWVTKTAWSKIKKIKKHPAVFESLTEMFLHYSKQLKMENLK